MTLLQERIAMFIDFLQVKASATSIVGAISGWLSLINISHAKDWAQFLAASVALLVSICALIISGPVAIKKLREMLKKEGDNESQ